MLISDGNPLKEKKQNPKLSIPLTPINCSRSDYRHHTSQFLPFNISLQKHKKAILLLELCSPLLLVIPPPYLLSFYFFLKHYSDYYQNDTLIAFLYCFCIVQHNKLSCKIELLVNKQIPLIGEVKVACSSSLAQQCFHHRDNINIFSLEFQTYAYTCCTCTDQRPSK